MINLTDDNFYLFAAKYYDNPQCTETEEFDDDLKRIRYLKRLFRKYKQTGELKDRLILNHLVVLYNVFVPEAATRMLCLKLSDELDMVKPFLLLLGYWPDKIISVNGVTISDSDIPLDSNIIRILRRLHG
jgi:hypothetical protein|tara:strand:- start:112 stop:501 length:390 start_codon:yes stop_codon:yes gene_type:complete